MMSGPAQVHFTRPNPALLRAELESLAKSSTSSSSESQLTHYRRLLVKVEEAIEAIQAAWLDFGGIEPTALSFNGGKDCTVLLHLMAQAAATFSSDNKSYSNTSQGGREREEEQEGDQEREKQEARLINTTSATAASSSESNIARGLGFTTMHVLQGNQFVEVEEFVRNCTQRYDLCLLEYNPPMKDALKHFLDDSEKNTSHARQPVKVIFLGQRRTDPYSEHLTIRAMTDKDWPQVLRVHPLLDWTYKDIWDYLLYFRVPYCCLYDQGYTSLGGTDNTKPTSALVNPKRICGYDPAYLLKDESLERQGRISKKY